MRATADRKADPREAGSGERPFYRAPHSDPDVLLRRLDAFDLSLRARDGVESVDEHREAFSYAEEQR
ncbi:hypothetical protein [Streptomyces rubiginosohelvolus]